MNCPYATNVAGFHQWNSSTTVCQAEANRNSDLGTAVGEAGKRRNGENKLTLRGFKIVYVFDISQTDGEPLPEPPDWKKA